MIWGDLRQGDVIRDPQTGTDWTIESVVGGNEVTGVVNVWVQSVSDPSVHYNVKQPWTTPAAIVARLPESPEPPETSGGFYVKPTGFVEFEGEVKFEQMPGMSMPVDAITAPDPLVVRGSEYRRQGEELAQESLRNPTVVQDPELTQSLEEEAAAVQAVFGEDKLDLLAAETTAEAAAREGATKEEPLVLPPIDNALALRSHLYLVHDLYIPDIDPRGPSAGAALKLHHQTSHQDGPMPHPHTHEGTAQ